MTRSVVVVSHDPTWGQKFQQEADKIHAALPDEIIKICHIGSTAIPGICAKPVLDFLIEVKDIHRIDQLDEVMTGLGYKPKGEFGIPRRRFFTKNNEAHTRTHHLHMFQTGDTELARHINFRDYMIAHPDEAQSYSDLKVSLAARFPNDMAGYIAGKDGFIKERDRRAALWRQSL